MKGGGRGGSGGAGRRDVTLPQGLDQLLHGDDGVDPVGVGTGEGEAVLQQALLGVYQGQGDAVRALGVVAGADAVEGALEGLLEASLHILQERAVDRAARQAHGALDDLDVLFLGVDVGLLELDVRVALVGGHEAGAHLHAGGAHLQELVDVRAVPDAARGDDRDGPAGLLLEFAHGFDDFGYGFFEGELGVVDLFGFEAEVSAGLGAFDHEGVGQVIELGQPFLADDGLPFLITPRKRLLSISMRAPSVPWMQWGGHSIWVFPLISTVSKTDFSGWFV